MNGVNEINNIYVKRTLKVVQDNPELAGFYSYLTKFQDTNYILQFYIKNNVAKLLI